MRKWLIGLVILVTVGWALAQTVNRIVPHDEPVTIAWDHDGIDMAAYDGRFVVNINGVDVGTIPWIDQPTFSYTISEGLPRGVHSIIVSACNSVGCASAPTFVVASIGAPNPPTNVR